VENNSVEQQLASFVHQRYREEYAECQETWGILEGKAQGLVAISGALLTALFAIITKGDSPVSLSIGLTLALSVTCLGLSLISAALVLKARKMGTPPRAAAISVVARDLRENLRDDESIEGFVRFLSSQYSAWGTAIDDCRRANEKKAYDLGMSQSFMLSALLLMLFLTIGVVVSKVGGA